MIQHGPRKDAALPVALVYNFNDCRLQIIQALVELQRLRVHHHLSAGPLVFEHMHAGRYEPTFTVDDHRHLDGTFPWMGILCPGSHLLTIIDYLH